MDHSSTGDVLFTKTQQQVLRLLYGKPDQSYYLNELVRLAGVGKGSLSRELDKFCQVGLLTKTRQGNQNHYQANNECPIFNELKTITQKTFGVVEVIQSALSPIVDQLDFAFIYGSMAKGDEHAASDIDLMLVGSDLSYSEIMEMLDPPEQQLGRPINPTIYTRAEFNKRVKNDQQFVTRVMEQPKLWIVKEDES